MKKIFTLCVLSVILVPVSIVHGHGLGLETTKLNINEKKLLITTQITPTEFSESAKKKIIITITDSTTSQNIDTTLLVALYHEEKQLFKENFFAPNGILEINIIPMQNSEINITGKQEESFGAWYGTESEPLQISGPLLVSGGLYSFDMEIKDIKTEPVNQGFSSHITMITNHGYDEQIKDGDQVRFNVRSYYDKVSSFDYDEITNSITLNMPFDWTEKNISHTEIVHEEIHFPKSFSNFFVPSYTASVNGIGLFKSGITIDDYSIEDERIVHFVLSQDTLRYLRQAQKDSGIENPQDMKFILKVGDNHVFPVIAMTKDESIQVDLSWEPEAIEPNKNTKFIYTFRDGKTGELLRNTSYDFVIVQNEAEMYRKSSNAQIGGDFTDYTFSESQTGITSIRFENLRGSDIDTEFTITVVPEFGTVSMIVLLVAIGASMIIMNNRLRIA